MTPQILKKQTHKPEIRVIKLLQMISWKFAKGKCKRGKINSEYKVEKSSGV
jgi:hypothetical protein